MSVAILKRKRLVVAAMAVASLIACSSHNDPKQEAIVFLSGPSFTVAGSGGVVDGTTNYLYATSAGTITAADNAIFAIFRDPYLPLSLTSTSLFSTQVKSGSCTLATPVAALSGSPASEVVTQIGGTSCTDQAVIDISLNTSYVLDGVGNSGTDTVTFPVTVDLAPEVATVATGNSSADGSGTADTTGEFSISTPDASIVVTFSKSVEGGTYNANMTGTGCPQPSSGTGVIVAGSNGESVAWPVAPPSGMASPTTCTFVLSNVKDAAGNAESSSDPNLSMTVTFEN